MNAADEITEYQAHTPVIIIFIEIKWLKSEKETREQTLNIIFLRYFLSCF
jgi:hypothetical protein